MTTLLKIAIEALWYFLPALLANVAPVIATAYNWLPSLNIPLDQGIIWKTKPLLGPNKTVRGIVVAVIFGSITGLLQHLAARQGWIPEQIFIDYNSAGSALLWGALLGCGAMVGDALKSFFKRRVSIPSGEQWIPWDQIDVVIGVLLITQWFAPLPLLHSIVALIIISCAMMGTSALGVKLGIKKSL
jgi:CDP-2,3-bis-(O-geranylgeranyl)-sn-glycerol synthase